MPQGIIEALRHDHDEVREMFGRLDAATGEQRRDLFQQLVSELVRHEVAEEEILRPVSKRDAGEEIANARINEESQAEQLLKEMEKLDPASAEFTSKLAELRREVEDHALAEETQEFPKVAEKETTERLERMGKAYEVAKKMAPTRPHPSMPNTPVANMLVGPFAAVIDRARDAVREALKSTS
ncbi:MAG TPA: hemerythrin domain-containing protein [Streptosporangiaceae bacterium]|jgi:hemerythrin superfamily protein|nr:hemerythrin domain-containing protein [Streptosporangiaceae bacterium]